MAKACIGIDLGGTFIKFALLDEQLSIQAQLQAPTPADGGPDAVIEAMAAGAKQLLEQQGMSTDQVLGVGIGSPGPLDLENGIVIGTPNIPGFQNLPIRDRLSQALELPAELENDANAAALGEFLLGRGKHVQNMVLLTLGTGIGSGIVVEGRLIHGAHGIGAECGHMIVQPGGELCGCGQRGCLERYASATYLAQHARRLVEVDHRPSSLAEVLRKNGDIDARDIQAARRAGDPLAEEVWDRATLYLAIGCVSLCRVFDPDLIVLSGGLTNAGSDLTQPLMQHFRRQHWTLAEPRTDIVLSALGNDVGVIGAACVALQKFRK
jgi:glucokinase